MSAPFDLIASQYDSIFTNGSIGQLQRQHVWNYLEGVLPELAGLEILELNCGTGEDALLFSEKGFTIMATDVSTEMLKVTQQKAKQSSMQHRISSQYLDLENFDQSFFDKKFDLVFSNFGGLNCVQPGSLQLLLEKIPSLLNPGGRFIAVIMPRFCMWESIYFLFKLQRSSIFRRWTASGVNANLHGTDIKVWYYHPSQVKKWSSKHFKTVAILPIGFAVPPSYQEAFFIKKKRTLFFLNTLESAFSRISMLSGLSDHYLIDLKIK